MNPDQDWHSCRRWWRYELECPFKGWKIHEELVEDDDDDSDGIEKPPVPAPKPVPVPPPVLPPVLPPAKVKEPGDKGDGPEEPRIPDWMDEVMDDIINDPTIETPGEPERVPVAPGERTGGLGELPDIPDSAGKPPQLQGSPAPVYKIQDLPKLDGVTVPKGSLNTNAAQAANRGSPEEIQGEAWRAAAKSKPLSTPTPLGTGSGSGLPVESFVEEQLAGLIGTRAAMSKPTGQTPAKAPSSKSTPRAVSKPRGEGEGNPYNWLNTAAGASIAIAVAVEIIKSKPPTGGVGPRPSTPAGGGLFRNWAEELRGAIGQTPSESRPPPNMEELGPGI